MMGRRLPKGWRAYDFDEVASIASGQADPRKDEYSGMLLVGSDNLPSGGGLLVGDIGTAKVAGAISGKYVFEPGQVIYSKIRPNLNKVWFSTFSGLCSADIYPITFDDAKLIPEYAYYCMLSDQFRKVAVSASMRSGIPKINREDLSSVVFRVPERDEQRRIVAVLDGCDRLVRGEQRKLLLLNALRGGVLARQGTRTGLKADKTALSALAEIRLSGVDKKTVDGELPVRLCNYMDVFYNERIGGTLDFMSATATPAEIERFTLRQGDVLLTKDSETAEEIAECAVVDADLPGVLCGYHLALLRPHDDRVLGHYLAIALRDPRVRYQFASCANGVTRFGLTLDTFDQVEIAVPPPEEQHRIADTYATLSAQISDTAKLIERLGEQKRGLMQKLLTGEWRLTHDLPETEAVDVGA